MIKLAINKYIPKVHINGIEIPENFLKQAYRIEFIKESSYVDQCIITFRGDITIDDIKTKSLKINGEFYNLIESQDFIDYINWKTNKR